MNAYLRSAKIVNFAEEVDSVLRRRKEKKEVVEYQLEVEFCVLALSRPIIALCSENGNKQCMQRVDSKQISEKAISPYL